MKFGKKISGSGSEIIFALKLKAKSPAKQLTVGLQFLIFNKVVIELLSSSKIISSVTIGVVKGCTPLVNKLVPCAWLLSGGLEVSGLGLRLLLCDDVVVSILICQLGIRGSVMSMQTGQKFGS